VLGSSSRGLDARCRALGKADRESGVNLEVRVLGGVSDDFIGFQIDALELIGYDLETDTLASTVFSGFSPCRSTSAGTGSSERRLYPYGLHPFTRREPHCHRR
jgi:hypothetical protein